ncbi:hypothetical protein L1049_015783 [Liquidambar formosana]|uniref:DUF4408 domain-containing protein n=1 Tax=Liquidambar formosana TaxID=63359 RepID=A0AAP0X2R4_LIQFO
MDSFHVNTVKFEKAHANLRHRNLRKITGLFRVIEICVILILISRLSLKVSTEYFRDLSIILISPRFVFVIGNAIVITLFVKSGQFSAKDGKGKDSETDLYEEFIKKSEKGQKIAHAEIEKQIKPSILEDPAGVEGTNNSVEMKIYRSQSENLKHDKCKQARHVLRRSATEKLEEKHSYPEDGMSNEEFRQTIEAFIARQQRFRREEEYSAFPL